MHSQKWSIAIDSQKWSLSMEINTQLPAWLAWLPTPRPEQPVDFLVAILFAHLLILALVTPPTPGWKLFRGGVVLPVVVSGLLRAIFCSIRADYTKHWGTASAWSMFIIFALANLLFYPPEESSYRVKVFPPSAEPGQTGPPAAEYEPEPVPPPVTFAKLCWAYSLVRSFRGIGWNTTASPSGAAHKHPYLRTSSRSAWFASGIPRYLVSWLVLDLVRSYMNLSPARFFFDGRDGIAPPFESLSVMNKATISTCVAYRVVWSTIEAHGVCGMLLVGIGGAFGWEGEIWSPWGWPPVYGGLGEIWRHPGLSNMWSRTWHQWYRRWVYLVGWLGIGETILGLPECGPRARQIPLPDPTYGPLKLRLTSSNTISSTNGVRSGEGAWPSRSETEHPSPSPSGSGSSSRPPTPDHPVPNTPPKRSSRGISFRMTMVNLIKSLFVFTLTGIEHDISTYVLLLQTASGRGKAISWIDAVVTTPFFALQPFGIATEAVIKRSWRSNQLAHPTWAKQEPKWLVLAERTFGFVLTWWFVGWAAQYYVVGATKAGMFRREGQPQYPSLFGGLIWGKWMHQTFIRGLFNSASRSSVGWLSTLTRTSPATCHRLFSSNISMPAFQAQRPEAFQQFRISSFRQRTPLKRGILSASLHFRLASCSLRTNGQNWSEGGRFRLIRRVRPVKPIGTPHAMLPIHA